MISPNNWDMFASIKSSYREGNGRFSCFEFIKTERILISSWKIISWVENVVFNCKALISHSAPSGNSSPSGLQSVRDEVFINIFDEVVHETSVVSKATASLSPFQSCFASWLNTLCSLEWTRQREISPHPGGEVLAGLCQDSIQHHFFSVQGKIQSVCCVFISSLSSSSNHWVSHFILLRRLMEHSRWIYRQCYWGTVKRGTMVLTVVMTLSGQRLREHLSHYSSLLNPCWRLQNPLEER